MSEKKKFPRVTTAVGTAKYPKLNKPDTKFVKEGEYSVKLAFTEEAMNAPLKSGQSLADTINAMVDEEFARVEKGLKASTDIKKRKKAATLEKVNPIKDEENDEGEATGNSVLNFKMKAVIATETQTWTLKPDIFDAHGQKLANPPTIWGGSKLKVAAELVPYYNPKDNVVGVSLRLRGVQIIELVTGTGGTAEGYGFGEEDGYTFTDTDATTPANTSGVVTTTTDDDNEF